MTLYAVFIGINKHSDVRVHELTGATRDATALWALFKDSVNGLVDRRLLDGAATAAAIRQALDASLGIAAEDDTVIVFFAGHGTPRHQLVPYDTDIDAIDDTTIPMQELADRLRETAARASLVILDCCFSGAAPARVLEGIPVARDVGMRAADLGGNGRVVLAAARDDQEALELGLHGLFTAAMLRVLQGNPDWTDIGVMMDEITRQVRAEATRTGHEQTPVWAGLIEGGIALPPLRPGPVYAAEFPDTTGIRVGPALDHLSAFGLPQTVLEAWAGRFPELNGMQLSAVNDYRLLDGSSMLVVAPTTSGKTFIGELAAARAIAEGRKAVFLLPFKALTNEKYEEFDELYGGALGLRVLRCTGDYADQTEEFVKGQYDMALLTYEMFLALSVGRPALMGKIGLVVLDEAQFITDPTRGIGVELLLTNLLAARDQGFEPQLVALSAVIGDINHFDEWLGCQNLTSYERPVPLIEGVLDRSGTFQFLDPDGNEGTEKLLEPHEVVQRRGKPGSQDVIVPLVDKLVRQGEQVLIFRNRRGVALGCARYLSAGLGLPPAQAVLDQLPDHDPSTTSQALREALQGGTALHTSDLSREERIIVERAFRDRGGPIRAMTATSTVAAGVNTPAETVIIVETEFAGQPPQQYTVAEYKNMAGRAGRLGLARQGRSILLAENAIDRGRLFRRYVLGNLEPIRSSFDPRELDTWALRLLAHIREIPRDAVVTLLAKTYAGYLESRRSPTWEADSRVALEALVRRMLDLGLLEVEMGLIRLSLLGRACGRSYLKLRSAMRLVELLRGMPEGSVTAENLLVLIHALPEFDDAYTPMQRRGRKETEWSGQVARHYGPHIARTLQRGAPDNMAYSARCKRVAVLRAWTAGVPINEIERRFTVNPFASVGAGDVRAFANLARFHLSAALEIADVLLPSAGPAAEDVDRLLAQLEFGIPVAALGLLDLPVSLPRGTYLALHEVGVSEPKAVWALPKLRLREITGADAAERLETVRPAGTSEEVA